MRAHTHTHTHTRTQAHTHTTDTHTHTHIHTHTSTHTYTRHTHTHTHARTHARTHALTHARTHAHTRTHTHTHTHVQPKQTVTMHVLPLKTLSRRKMSSLLPGPTITCDVSKARSSYLAWNLTIPWRSSGKPAQRRNGFKRTLIYYDTDTQSANLRGNPLRQATKLHLNNS